MQTKQENFTLSIKYDEDSIEKGLIKITPKEGVTDIVLEIDSLLDIIAKHSNRSELAMSLSDAEMSYIPMLNVTRTFNFLADRDYKLGELVHVNAETPYPVMLYAAEKAFNYCKETNDANFYTLPKTELRNQIDNLHKNNEGFVKHWQNIIKSEQAPVKVSEEAMAELNKN